MLKPVFAAAVFFAFITSQTALAEGLVTCHPQLQPVSNPNEPGIELNLRSGETARREYELPNSDLSVTLALNYTPTESQNPANPTRGQLTISKTYLRNGQFLTMRGQMVIEAPRSLYVRESNSELELAGHPGAVEGAPRASIIFGSSNGPVPRYRVDCEVRSR